MRFAAVACVVLLCGAGAQAFSGLDILGNLPQILSNIAQGKPPVGVTVTQAMIDQAIANLKPLLKRDLDLAKIQNFIQQASQVVLQHLGPAKDKILAHLQQLFDHAKQISSLDWVSKGATKRDLHLGVKRAVAETKRAIRKDLNAIVDSLLNGIKDVALQTLGQLGQHLVSQLPALIGKRGIIDALQPHIDTVTNIASSVGNAIAGHATNVWNTVQGHISTLGDKLQPHIDTISGHVSNIIGHGQNGIDAIQDAVTDILNQTFQNISGNVSGIANAGSAAVGTVVDHVSGSITGK